jgi:hypothetical protein
MTEKSRTASRQRYGTEQRGSSQTMRAGGALMDQTAAL